MYWHMGKDLQDLFCSWEVSEVPRGAVVGMGLCPCPPEDGPQQGAWEGCNEMEVGCATDSRGNMVMICWTETFQTQRWCFYFLLSLWDLGFTKVFSVFAFFIQLARLT